MRVSCTKMEDILTVAKGPRANPARRFAIWALSHKAGLSHKDIAATLYASQHQVAKALNRMRNKENSLPMKDWIERFHAEDK